MGDPRRTPPGESRRVVEMAAVAGLVTMTLMSVAGVLFAPRMRDQLGGKVWPYLLGMVLLAVAFGILYARFRRLR